MRVPGYANFVVPGTVQEFNAVKSSVVVCAYEKTFGLRENSATIKNPKLIESPSETIPEHVLYAKIQAGVTCEDITGNSPLTSILSESHFGV